MRRAREKGVSERVKRVGCERGEREREREWSVRGRVERESIGPVKEGQDIDWGENYSGV